MNLNRFRNMDVDYNMAYYSCKQEAGEDARNIDMAESQAIHAVDSVLDIVLNNGGKHLYEQYLQPKLKPYMVATFIQMFEIYAAVSSAKLIKHLFILSSRTFR